MLALHPTFITDESEHKQSVLLPYKEWEQIMEDYELGLIVHQRQAEKNEAIEITLDEL